MTEYINSFFSNMKEKATNPFLGTVILVMLFRYWEVLYAMFAFDDDCDMLYKQTYIRNFFARLHFWKEVRWVVFESFCVLIGTYVLITGSRLIVNFFNKQVLARADKITDANSVKTLAEFNAVEKRLGEAFEQLRKVNNENNELELRIGQYKNEVNSQQLKISELTIQRETFSNRLKELETEKLKFDSELISHKESNLELTKNLEIARIDLETTKEDLTLSQSNFEELGMLINFSNDRETNSPLEFKCGTLSSITAAFDVLEAGGLLDEFIHTIIDIQTRHFQYNSDTEPGLMKFIQMGLVKVLQSGAKYSVTFLGIRTFQFIQTYTKMQQEYKNSKFSAKLLQEFENLPFHTYTEELKQLTELVIKGKYTPEEFYYPPQFQKFLLDNYYISFNNGFLEFTNKGLKMINYLQNIKF